MTALLDGLVFVADPCFSLLSVPIPSGLKCFCCKISWQSYWNSLLGNYLSLSSSFKILSLSLNFDILIMMCLGVGLLGFIFIGTLCFLNICDFFLHQVKEVFCHYFLKQVLYPLLTFLSFLNPYDADVMFLLSQSSFKLFSSLWCLFSFWCFIWVFFPPTLSSKLLI